MKKVEMLKFKEYRNMDFIEKPQDNEYLPNSEFVYIQRRVGFVVGGYDTYYWKIPHCLVPDSKEEGQQIKTICSECKYPKMHDGNNDEFYCPRCEEQS